MQQAGALQQRSQDGRLGPQLSRLLYHRRAAVWFVMLTLAGLAQIAGLIVAAIIVGGYEGLRHNEEHFSNAHAILTVALSWVVAVVATVYFYRTQKETLFDPPKSPMPRKRWRRYTNTVGVTFALTVAYTTWWIWMFLVLGLLWVTRLAIPSFGLPGEPLLWLLSIPVGLALWAFASVRHAALEALETAEPPQLRLAAELRQHLDALQKAYEELDVFSRDMQRVIEIEQEQLREIRELNQLESQLKALSDHAPAIRTAIAQEQSRSMRWGLLHSVMLAIVFLVIGLLIDALVNTDALGDQLRQWLHLG
jgi:hypothetical protein